jgi:hypothetical protein
MEGAMRYRVTVRGPGTELRGYASAEAVAALARDAADPFVVIASPASESYDPFAEDKETELEYLRVENKRLTTQAGLTTLQMAHRDQQIADLQSGLAKDELVQTLRTRNANLEERVRALMALNGRLLRSTETS